MVLYFMYHFLSYIQNVYRKMKKDHSAKDVMWNKQIRQTRLHYSHLHLAGEVCYWG
jgi:hypothetical protein